MPLDVERIREDFPLLSRTERDRPIAYLDNAATSQKPRSVVEAEERFYFAHNANVHRGVYRLSEEATDLYEGARETLAGFIGASDPSEVVFLRGATEGLNVIAGSLSRGRLKRGDSVLSTIMEHHSNIVPWQILRESMGIRLEFVDVDDEGHLRMDDVDRRLAEKPRVVTFTHVSNVLGTVNPVRELADKAHDAGALVVLDAAQSAPHRRLDVERLGVDLMTFSGHKMLGPTGIGVLWGRRALLETLPPWLGGGEMISEVHTDRVSFREPPARFEAGTPNAAGACGLAAAATYLNRTGFDEMRTHEEGLTRQAFAQARETLGEKIHFYGPPPGPDRESVLSFSLQGVHPHDIASLLDADGVAVRSGHHCAQPLMERLGVPALTRASPYCYNTAEEIDRLVRGLARIHQFFHAPPTKAAVPSRSGTVSHRPSA